MYAQNTSHVIFKFKYIIWAWVSRKTFTRRIYCVAFSTKTNFKLPTKRHA